jgi:hypothetical protein
MALSYIFQSTGHLGAIKVLFGLKRREEDRDAGL